MARACSRRDIAKHLAKVNVDVHALSFFLPESIIYALLASWVRKTLPWLACKRNRVGRQMRQSSRFLKRVLNLCNFGAIYNYGFYFVEDTSKDNATRLMSRLLKKKKKVSCPMQEHVDSKWQCLCR